MATRRTKKTVKAAEDVVEVKEIVAETIQEQPAEENVVEQAPADEAVEQIAEEKVVSEVEKKKVTAKKEHPWYWRK